MKPILLVIVMGAFMMIVLHDQPVSKEKNEQAKKEEQKQKAAIKEDPLHKENILEEFFINKLLW